MDGEIADDLTAYFYISEQQNSSVALGVKVERDLSVGAAGGMIIQMLPDAAEGVVDALEKMLGDMDPMTTIISRVKARSAGLSGRGLLQEIMDEIFKDMPEEFQPEILDIASDLPDSVCISPMGIQADLALTYFSEKHTDFNVFECGKGAKYDDVNNIRHDYAVINRIFLEHTRELGDTLTAIAEDKSHVITGEQKCVYFAEQEPEVLEVLVRRAEAMQVPYKIYGRDFQAENIRYTCSGMLFDVVIGDNIYPDLQIPLLGEHQAKNCALALALCVDVMADLCRESNAPDIFSDTMCNQIRRQLSAIHHPGRMEILSSDPFILLDACIHSASCENVKEVLRHLGISNCTVIVGIPEDKDYAGVIRSMREVANRIILTKSGNPHYHFSQKQQESLAEEGIGTIWTDSVQQALTLADSCPDPIVILGTTSVISEVERIFRRS